jgi:hypothetical protein
MLAVIRLGEGAYGVPVYREIEEQTGHGASFGRFTPLSTGWKEGLRLENWLLERLGVDVALAGDILEEYELRRSRVWFAKQVVVAVCAGVRNPVRDDKLTALRAKFIDWCAVSVWSLLIG